MKDNSQLKTNKIAHGGGNHPLKDQCPLSGPLCTKWVNDFIDIRKYAFYEFDYFFSNLEGPIPIHRGCRIFKENFQSKAHQMIKTSYHL